MLYTINLEFNNLSNTLEYLKKMYPIMEANGNVDENFFVPNGFCAHLGKIVSLDINKFSPEIPKRIYGSCNYIIYMWDEIWDWWRNFVVIFQSKSYTFHVQNALTKMNNLLKQNIVNIPEISSNSSSSNHHLKFSDSPFFILFHYR